MNAVLAKIVMVAGLVATIAPKIVDVLPPNAARVVEIVGAICATFAGYMHPSPGSIALDQLRREIMRDSRTK